MAQLKKDQARSAMEAACRRTGEKLLFLPPCIPHSVAVMVMALTSHTEDPDRVGEDLNIFLFPDLSPLEGSDVALLTRKWGAILGGGTLTSFADKSMLMGNQKVSPIIGWDKSVSQLEAWTVFCTVFPGDDSVNLATYKMFLLMEETSGVSPRLRVQAH